MINIKIILLILLANLIFCEISNGQNSSCQTGIASYYASEFHGRKTASGEKYNMHALTAAHNTLPFNTYVKVTNLNNNQSVVVRINDRGPFSKKRIIDVSKAAAKELGLLQCGVAKVKVEVINKDVDDHIVADKEVQKEKEEKTDGEKEIKNEKEVKKEETRELKKDIAVNHLENLKKTKFQIGNIYDTKGNKVKPTGYGIQLISLTDNSKTLEEVEKLESKFKNLYIEVAEVKSKIVYRIITGKFPDKKAAQQELKNVKSAGYKGLIKKYKK